MAATTYLVVTVLAAVILVLSAVMKIRHNPNVVKVIHETIGVPLKYFPVLAACEVAGAVGLVAGIWYPPLGVAAGVGLVIYFIGAVVSHVRVGDFKGVGSAVVMLGLSAAALALRIVTR